MLIPVLAFRMPPRVHERWPRPAQAAREEEEQEEEGERCRLCLGGEEDGPLLQLCACRGSARLVHRHCLETWRRTSDKEDAAYRCGECKDEYRDALSLELLSARLQDERAYGEGTPFTLYTLAYELQAQGKFDEADRCTARCWRWTAHPWQSTTRHARSIGNLGLLLQARATSPPSRCTRGVGGVARGGNCDLAHSPSSATSASCCTRRPRRR